MKSIIDVFRLPTAAEIRRRQHDEAARLELENQAAAEHFQSQANMYRNRRLRLARELTEQEQRGAGNV